MKKCIKRKREKRRDGVERRNLTDIRVCITWYRASTDSGWRLESRQLTFRAKYRPIRSSGISRAQRRINQNQPEWEWACWTDSPAATRASNLFCQATASKHSAFIISHDSSVIIICIIWPLWSYKSLGTLPDRNLLRRRPQPECGMRPPTTNAIN